MKKHNVLARMNEHDIAFVVLVIVLLLLLLDDDDDDDDVDVVVAVEVVVNKMPMRFLPKMLVWSVFHMFHLKHVSADVSTTTT